MVDRVVVSENVGGERKPLVLSSWSAFTHRVPVRGGVVRYVQLEFATFLKKLNGVLNLTIMGVPDNSGISYPAKVFRIDMKDIEDNKPFMLDLGGDCLTPSLDFVFVPEYHDTDGPLALWYSNGTLVYKMFKEDHAFLKPIDGPLISIITGTCDINPNIFKETAKSVLQQNYRNWEWIISDDASSNPDLVQLIDGIVAKDRRVQFIKSKKRLGIAGNQNRALSKVKGDWVTVLDHDDTLSPSALSEVALVVNEHPQSWVVYSDEDKIDDYGNYCEPFYKPDWSPALLSCHNYINHLCVFNVKRIKNKG